MTRYALLAGFARDSAHQFAHAANHFACLAWRHREPIVTVDLRTGDIVGPACFDIERNRTLARRCADSLAGRVAGGPHPEPLAEAVLEARFELTDVPDPDPGAGPPGELPVRVVVRILDDRGRSHTGRFDHRVFVQC